MKEQEIMDENHEPQIRKRPKAEPESVFTNELTQLGNQAVKKGLISGHGYHGGPEQAHSYLKDLVKQHQK
jgi:hypothetical protein